MLHRRAISGGESVATIEIARRARRAAARPDRT
jgi:hypothetical protein